METVFESHGLTKRYGSVTALDHVELELRSPSGRTVSRSRDG